MAILFICIAKTYKETPTVWAYTKMETLPIARFDIRVFQGESAHNVAIIGKRETGKSTLVRDLLRHCRKDQNFYATIITQSGETPMYREQSSNYSILGQYDDSVIEDYLTKLKSTRAPSNSALVLDDCMYDNRWFRNKYTRALFANGRTWKSTLLLAMSYPLRIPSVFSASLDYVFLFREAVVSNKKRIWETYTFGAFPTFELFCAVFDDAASARYDALVIKNCEIQCELCDKIFWYKADPELGRARLGQSSEEPAAICKVSG